MAARAVGGDLARLRRSFRPGHVAVLGIYLFLQAAYLFHGALGSARYYESLTPFVALGAAHGVELVGRHRRWIARSVFVVAFSRLLVLSVRFCGWEVPTRPARSAGAHTAPHVTGRRRGPQPS